MNITVTFRCKKSTAYWLKRSFGNPVRFPHKSIVKHTFLNSLSKKFQPSDEKDLRQYPEAVEIFINQDDISTHGLHISAQLQHNLNRTIEDELKIGLHSYIFAHVRRGMTVDKAVLLFQAEFGFKEEVFSSDAIRQAYFRREKELKNIFRGSVTKNKNYVS